MSDTSESCRHCDHVVSEHHALVQELQPQPSGLAVCLHDGCGCVRPWALPAPDGAELSERTT